jgi:hypothetical protein
VHTDKILNIRAFFFHRILFFFSFINFKERKKNGEFSVFLSIQRRSKTNKRIKHQYAIEQDQEFHKFVPIDHHYKKAFDSLEAMEVEVAVVVKVDLKNEVFDH